MTCRNFIVALVVVMLFSTLTASQSTESLVLPRMAWGNPDLQGILDFRTITPLERPEELGDKAFLTEEEAAKLEQEIIDRNENLLNRPARRTEVGASVDRGEGGAPGAYNNFWFDQGTNTVGTRRTSLIIDPPNGRLPDLSVIGQRRTDQRRAYLEEHPADSYEDRNSADRCIVGFNAGPPITPLAYNQNMQLFQTRDYVVVYTEMVHTARIVPLDGRPALNGDIRLWSGDSRGYWDGDTLVVETANFDDKRRWVPLGSARPGMTSTGKMTLAERFTRVDADTLEYTFTVIDTDTWASEWTASMPMRRTDSPLFEYACHEGNYSMEGILAGHRAEEQVVTEELR